MPVAIALTIAGSDSGGGAGIQGDIKTFSALGVYGASVITAITAQNTSCVRSVFAVPADVVAQQIEAVLSDFSVAAVKIGMLATSEIARCVFENLSTYSAKNAIVLDPVIRSTSGAKLLEDSAILVLRKNLIPISTVITPNLDEAAVLLGTPLQEVIEDRYGACRELIALGAKVVVLTGGHGRGEFSEDFYYDGTRFEQLSAPWISTQNTHGTGCAFSSAIAAFLAKGIDVFDAVQGAKLYISKAIESADLLGVGTCNGPVDHFFGASGFLVD